MPTGLKNSPSQGITDQSGIIGSGAKPSFPSLPRAAINQSVKMIFAATGTPQMSQPVHVPAGSTVYIRAHNGAAAGNTAICRVALSREGLVAGSAAGDTLTPDTEINYPVDNLGQIWAVGTQNDGIIISIRAGTQVL